MFSLALLSVSFVVHSNFKLQEEEDSSSKLSSGALVATLADKREQRPSLQACATRTHFRQTQSNVLS